MKPILKLVTLALLTLTPIAQTLAQVTVFSRAFTTSSNPGWVLSAGVTWGNHTTFGGAGFLFSTGGNTVTSPSITTENLTGMSVTISAWYGNYINLRTSSDGTNWSGITPFSGGNRLENATLTLPNGTRFLRFEARSGTVNDVNLRSVTVTMPFVAVTNITGVPTAATAGTPLTLSGTVVPSNATNQTITWSVVSAGTTGATISGNTLNTTAAGTVQVRATITNGATATTNYIQNFNITVTAPFVAVTNITGVPTTATAGTPLRLLGTVNPNNATNRNITWSVVNAGTTGATISNDTLRTTAAGTARVRATITNGATTTTNYTQEFDITVSTYAAVTNITGVPTTTVAGVPLRLTGTVVPSNAANQTIVWSVDSARTTGATISNDTLRTTGTGTVQVRATIAGGTSPTTAYTQTFNISVTFNSVANITGVPTTKTAGVPLRLFGTVTPSNATNQTIVWSVDSARTTGATISNDTLRTTAPGTVLVRATVPRGISPTADYTRTFNITATYVAVTNITNVPTQTTAGVPLRLSGTVVPDSATNQTIVWSVVSAGTTGATISGDTLRVTSSGTAQVRATVANGATPTTAYTQNFNITVVPFVAVTGISDLPTTAVVNVPLRLQGVVNPNNASDQSIAWNVVTAGTTGATISRDTLRTTAVGTARLRATIANGAAINTTFTHEFDVAVVQGVVFQTNGGSTVSPQNFTIGQPFGTLPTTTRANYTFMGWSSNIDLTNLITADSIRTASITTLYAIWGRPTAFTVNGGTSIASRVYQINKRYREVPLNEGLPTPIKTGSRFVNWFREATFVNVVTDTSMVRDQNTELHARWVDPVAITFNPNGGTPTTIAQRNLFPGFAFRSPENGNESLPTVTRSGHHFLGWYTDTILWNRRVSDTSIVPNVATQLHARWAVPVTITFNANSGTVTPSSRTLAPGFAFFSPENGNQPLPTPTRSGNWIFAGWFTDNNTWTTPVTNSSIVPNANTTIFARWVEPVTVSFNTLGGNTITQRQFAPGFAYNNFPPASLPIPVREGFEFAGWSADILYENQVFNSDMVRAVPRDTLYAVWGDRFRVVFEQRNGQPPVVREYFINRRYDQSISTGGQTFNQGFPTDPTPPTGQLFLGWFSDTTAAGVQMLPTMIVDQQVPIMYARFSQRRTINFQTFGGSTISPLQYFPGYPYSSGAPSSNPGFPTPPTRSTAGQPDRFLGWYTNSSLEDQFLVTQNSIVGQNVDTLYAKWSVLITVVFENFGGVSGVPERRFYPGLPYTHTSQPAGGGLPTILSVPAGAGPFIAWYSDPSFRHEFIVRSTDIVNENITKLYARYTSTPITIHFQAFEGTVSGGTSRNYFYGFPYLNTTPSNQGLPTATRANSHFLSWHTNNNFTPESLVTNTCIVEKEMHNQIIFARWSEQRLINYNTDGATSAQPAAQNFWTNFPYRNSGTPSNPGLPANNPTKTNSTFLGWFTDPHDPLTRVSDHTIVAENVSTLHARWSTRVPVAFHTNGGRFQTASDANPRLFFWGFPFQQSWEQTGWNGNPATPNSPGLPTNPVFGDTMHFVGWYDNPNFTGEIITNSSTVWFSQDTIRLYARWAPRSTVVFLDYQGLITSPQTRNFFETFRYDQSPNQGLINPTITSMAFVGWFNTIAGTRGPVRDTTIVPNRNHTLFANWRQATIPVTNITNVPTTVIMGTPLTLTGTVVPDSATHKTIVWRVDSARTTGATITGNTLNTTGVGIVTVRATIANAGRDVCPISYERENYTQTFNITVNPVPHTPVTNISGVPTAVVAGTPLTLTGTVVPANATNRTIVWSVQNAGGTGATITGGNTLNVTAAGTVTIRATITNGLTATTNYIQDFSITATVTPPPFVAVTNITGVPTAAVVGTPLALVGTVVPSNATNQTIVWTVQNAGTTGATITGTTLNATAAGTVTVRATITNGLTATTNYTQTFNITVTGGAPPFVAVTNIASVPTAAVVGTPLTLTGTVVPANATNQTIVWTVQNAGTTGATITGTTLNATAAGTVTVRATITNGATATTNYTQDFPITVTTTAVAVTSVQVTDVAGTNITGTLSNLQAGQTRQLLARVLPENATNKNVTWSSSDTNVATVNSSGLVTAKIQGVVTISVRTHDGDHSAMAHKNVTGNANIRDVETYGRTSLQVYPNPTTDGDLIVVIPNEVWDLFDVIELFDMSGRLVLSHHTPRTSHPVPVVINISHLPNGMYVVVVGNRSVRIVKR